MPAAAPRLDPRLIDRLENLARKELSYAEIRRMLVVRATELGLPPPSYEHIRRLVLTCRAQRESEAEMLPLALAVALGTSHGNELLSAVRGGAPQKA
jgi:hypothetical protein